jgi:glycosyltransferase involved in cell wall biosynthesis
LKIAAFEGFYGGSHRKWLDGFAMHTVHDVRIFHLPGRSWKWRMHGGAITLAKRFNESDFRPDFLLVTDMIDLNVLLSLTRKRTAHIPVVFYFHENQINYPWSDIDRDVKYQRDHHYGFINYASAFAADIVLFNSQYHMQAFIDALPGFLKMFPDFQNAITIDRIKQKSRVLPIGIDLRAFDTFRTDVAHDLSEKEASSLDVFGNPVVVGDAIAKEVTANVEHYDAPVILWNHRWEFDKNPQTFFDVMQNLHNGGLAFKLIVCGERTEMYPKVFDEIKGSLEDHILYWGYADNFEQYVHLLFKSDILPVTSDQDFFGISAVEAMYCGVFPLLPDRLAFPEHIPDEHRKDHLYANKIDLTERLIFLLKNGVPQTLSKEWVARYDWEKMIRAHDAIFQ